MRRWKFSNRSFTPAQNKHIGRYVNYLRLLLRITGLPETASAKLKERRSEWEQHAQRLAVLLGRDYVVDVGNVCSVVDVAVAVGVPVQRVQGEVMPWNRQPSPYWVWKQNHGGGVVGGHAYAHAR